MVLFFAMLKVECESCHAPYQVDERRVPPTGLKMRCPKCGHSFVVTTKGDAAGGTSTASAAAVGAPPAPAMTRAPTMVGMGAADFDLPAIKAGAIRSPGAPFAPPAPIAQAPFAPPAPIAQAPFGAPGAPSFSASTGGTGGFGDLDLPAIPSKGDVSSAMRGRPPGGPPVQPAFAAPSPPLPGGGFGELDLPALPNSGGAAKPGGMDLPAKRAVPTSNFGSAPAQPAQHAAAPPIPSGFGGGFGELDLPAVVRGGPGAPGGHGGFGGPNDLPSLSGGGGAGLPMAAGGGVGLPMTAGSGLGLPAARGGFGDLDLPALGGDLPIATHNNLPANAYGNLPAMAGDLPSMAGGLPMAAGSLPMAAGSLPMMAGGLPMAQNSLPMAGGSLPMPQGSLPMAAGSLPMAQGELPALQSSLPGLAGLFEGGGPSISGGGGLVSFGEMEPGEASLSTAAPGGAGGMSFGEVDLGDDIGPSAVMAPPAAISGALSADSSADAPVRQAPALRPREYKRGFRFGLGAKIGLGALLAIILGGFALELTPAGMFGNKLIMDTVKAPYYRQVALDAGQKARRQLTSDGYQAALATADETVSVHNSNPRARSMAAYATFTEFSIEARFGADPARGARAKTFIADFAPGTDIPYLLAAQGAQELVAGDLPHARAHLADAAKHDAQDPIAQEIAQDQGELELLAGDGNAALAAFVRAHGKGATARSLFGTARAYALLGKTDEAKKAITATLAQVPAHAGALILRANLEWKVSHDDLGSLKDLTLALDGPGKPNASPRERAAGLALRGWVLLARDHAGEARAAFEEAVKIDPKNVTALMGQGEIFYADGRYTEAATRFDEASIKDPTNSDAVIGAGKTKIKLERFQDAKNQLVTAEQTFPKDMRVFLWHARAEEALGNRQVAEGIYNKSIALSDPKQADAILPYGMLSEMLAAEGRIAEAQGKLDEAKTKLPDSPALQRALAEVAVAQGQYDDAVEHYMAALAQDPQDLGAHFKLGVTYRKMHKLDLATKEFDIVTAQDKDFPGLTLERGQLYEDAGQADEALAQFKTAFDKAPQDVDLKLRMGAAYVALNDIDNAMKFLREVLEVRPTSAEAKHYLGRAYLKRGGTKDADAALGYFQQAVNQDGNKAVYQMYVAWAANATSPVQGAVAQNAVDKALAIDRQYGDAYWQRGIIEYHANALKDALKDLKRALELSPGRVEAHATLAEVYEAMNDDATAQAEWQKVIAVIKTNFDWDFEYGSLLAEKGRVGDAASMLGAACTVGDAMQTKPGRLFQAHLRYADLLKKSGKKADAITHYKAYLKLAPATDPDRKTSEASIRALGGNPEDE